MNYKSWTTTNNINIFKTFTKGCNCYVIIQNDNAILFDTSKEFERKKLVIQINDILNINKAKLKAIVLSHNHFDHSGNSAFLCDYYNCPVLIHKNEFNEFCNGKTLFPIGVKNPLKIFTIIMNKIFFKFDFMNLLTFEKCNQEKIITVENNFNLFQYGVNTELIHTPGHTNGSISMIINNEIALVGSAIVHFTKHQLLPPMANLPDLIIPSLKRILQTGCSLLLPAHGNEISADFVMSTLKK